MKTTNGYDTQIGEKANSAFARRFRELASSAEITKNLSNYLGVTVQTINKFKLGQMYPKTENVIKIARFFSVSIDYLLGETDEKTVDVSIQAMCDYTGLSEKAVEKLHVWKTAQDKRAHWSRDYVSEFITYYDWENILERIGYMDADKRIELLSDDSEEDAKNDFIANLWFVSKSFSDMVSVLLIDKNYQKYYKGDQ